MVFLIIRAYLVHKTRNFKLLVFGLKLVEIGQLFRLFCCAAYSPYTQSALFKLKIVKK
jgi:hypothetical protein